MRIYAALAIALFGLALMPLPVRADEQEDKNACMGDAFSICGQFIPDRDRVGACLFANRSHVSPECRTALKGYNPGRSTSADTASRSSINQNPNDGGIARQR